MTGLDPHVRIGEYYYLLAEADEWYQRTGLHPMDRDWRSIFPGKQNVQGLPGVQNVRDDDLRWVTTSFAGGGGLAVIDPSRDEDFRRFDRSIGVDLGSPGEIRLAKETFTYAASGGGAPATHEGSTFADSVGASSVVGSDRRLNNEGDRIFKDVTLAAGDWQIALHANAELASTVITELGKDLEVFEGEATDVGNSVKLKEGAKVRSSERTFDPGVSVQTQVTMRFVCSQPATAIAQVVVSDVGTGNQAASEQVTLQTGTVIVQTGSNVVAPPSESTEYHVTILNWIPRAGHTYRVRVFLQSVNAHVARQFYVDDIRFTATTADAARGLWEILQGATVRAGSEVNLSGSTVSHQVGAAIVHLSGSTTLRLRFQRTTGPASILFDKAIITPISMQDAQAIELGIDNKVWMVTGGPTPALWAYNSATATWQAKYVLPAGSGVTAMTHNAMYQYLLVITSPNSFTRVHAVKADGTAHILTANDDQITTIVAGADRIYGIREHDSSGAQLVEVQFEGTNVPWTSRGLLPGSTFGGFSGDDYYPPQRMAGWESGVVWFVNQGPSCWIYQWNGTVVAPLTSLPTGFVSYAIAHAAGTTYAAGTFPGRDSNVETVLLPCIFIVRGSIGTDAEVSVELMDISLSLEDEPSSKIAAVQTMGSDLFVQTEVATDATHTLKRMRLWRVSLRGAPAAFLEQEVEIAPDYAAGRARGLAVTWRDRFLIWSAGGPWQVSERYLTSGDSYIRTARYSYGLLERKLLLAVDVIGDFPDGTYAELYYSLNGGEFIGAGQFTTSGRRVVSVPHNSAFFTDLALECRLRSTDPTVTPVVYSFDAVSTLQEYDRAWNLLLFCADEQSTWHRDGAQVPGLVGIDYLLSLADSGGVVEFEDFFGSKKNDESRLYMVTVESPRPLYVRRGEALVRVRLSERGLIPR